MLEPPKADVSKKRSPADKQAVQLNRTSGEQSNCEPCAAADRESMPNTDLWPALIIYKVQVYRCRENHENPSKQPYLK